LTNLLIELGVAVFFMRHSIHSSHSTDKAQLAASEPKWNTTKSYQTL